MIYLQDSDFTLHQGDVLDVLREMPSESVDCVITSPPFWGLRDYGSEGQLGLEPTPEQYVGRMTAVFREVRRVLAAHGTCWLNMGDTYNSRLDGSHGGWNGSSPEPQAVDKRGPTNSWQGTVRKLAQKQLLGMPWRLAFALQADGWYLRSDIIWSKPNPMPESVTDRPTKAHEYVFLLTKSPRYFFDQEAVREPLARPLHSPDNKPQFGEVQRNDFGTDRMDAVWGSPNGRNIRSVWEIATQPYPEAHFATFPEELAWRCLLAGCPEQVCGECGKPRMVEVIATPLGTGPSEDPTPFTGRKGMNRARRPDEGTRLITKGEQRAYAEQLRTAPEREQMAAQAGPAFAHYIRTDDSGARPIPPDLLTEWTERGWLRTVEPGDCGHDAYRPGIVLDPFMGSGTTALVARKHARHAVGIELNAEYCELIVKRTQQLSLLA